MTEDMQNIQLLENGHDPFIDYMKGICILAVVIQHAVTLPGWEYTICQQVPLFLLIQVFHSYKHGLNNVKSFSMRKCWNRILKPFLILQIFLVLAKAYQLGSFHILKGWIRDGGIGPGSYYPWIYLQFAILLPLFAHLFKGRRLIFTGGVICLVSVACEIVGSLVSIPDFMWRLLCCRYVFLIFLGIVWVENGLRVNRLRIWLMLLSIVAITFFSYTDVNLQPFFIKSGWTYCHWICYFWVAFGIPPILWWFWKHSANTVNKLICWMGEVSWEIFLFQMVVFLFIPKQQIMTILGNTVGCVAYAVLTIFISIAPILAYKKAKMRLNKRP